MIINLEIDKDKSSVKWVFDDKEYNYIIENIDQTLEDECNKIIILSGPQAYPDRLTVIDGCGVKLFSCYPPDGTSFYYLTKDSSNNILIACTFEEKIEGWYDWHYSLDLTNKDLVRGAPVY